MGELHHNSIDFYTFNAQARAVLEWPNDTLFERDPLRDAVQWPKHMERALDAMARGMDTRKGPRPRKAWISNLLAIMTEDGASGLCGGI